MTRTIQDDGKLRNALGREMIRVDTLRMRIDMNDPNNLFVEFWMRRALLRAKFALMQRNMAETKRMLKLLAQIGCDGPR